MQFPFGKKFLPLRY